MGVHPPEEEGDPEAEEGAEMQGIGLSWPRRRAAIATRWSQPAAMGPRIRIQAAAGYRAAVIELRPGLFVVAEVPEVATRPAFGIAPLLAPLVVRAAKSAIDNPDQQPRRRHPLAALFQRRQQPALPGPAPAASTALVPADAEAERAAAAVGRWVGADDLAGVLGDCERGERR